MRVGHPLLMLVGVPAVAVMWWIARHGVRTVPTRQHRSALLVRSAVIVLVAVALAEPQLVLPVDERSVIFLLDRSESIGAKSRERQEQLVATGMDGSRPGDRSAVAVFGSETRVDLALSADRAPSRVRTVVDGSASDIGGALEAAAALLPSEGSRRVVLLTDLVDTGGSARAAAGRLADRGIAVDVVRLDSARSPDALVESVRLPPLIREGDDLEATVTVRSNVDGEALLRVRAGDREEQVVPVSVAVGSQEVAVDLDPPAASGFLPVVVSVDAPFDTRPENDRAEGITRVLGPARVVLVEGAAGEASALSEALEAGGVRVDVVRSIPSDTALLAYDALALVDVPRPTPEEASRLAAFVQDLGRGLVVVGGERAFGLGDYHESPLEALLPVSSNPDDLVRRQPVAEVLVIDTSGSMGACHCGSGAPAEGGVNKTDISRAGAALAIDALDASDRVGVLAFSSGYEWVLPIGIKPDGSTVDGALAGLSAAGDTEIAAALGEAVAQLRSVPESLRHIVLFTDGWDPNDANLLPAARSIADEGITLSVLGTGEGPGTTLRRMADLGGGRYYPGTDLESIPEIFVEETLTVARNLASEGRFLPVLGTASPVTERLAAAPPLGGYVLTKAKGTASVPLAIGQDDPLLATWQRGLGRVTAWTSDVSGRWSAGWVDWEGFVEFWGRVLRDVIPAGRESPPEVWAEGGAIRVRVDQRLEEGASAVARVRSPDGSLATIPMRRVGGSTVVGEAAAPLPGAYWVAVTVDNADGSGFTVSSGTVSAYEEEFSFRDPDPGLGDALTAVTGGRLDPPAASFFDPAPTEGEALRPIWTWLIGAALAGFLLDVALRRLVFAAGDAELWRQGMTPVRRRERRRIEEARRTRSRDPGRGPEAVSDSETLSRLMRRRRR